MPAGEGCFARQPDARYTIHSGGVRGESGRRANRRRTCMQPQIVVPLDGSSFAEDALPHAVAVARSTKSALVLLRVTTPPGDVERITWPGGAPWTGYADDDEQQALASSYLAS